MKLANGQNIINDYEKQWPQGFVYPFTGVIFHNIQTCLLVYTTVSGECLQDQWSSGLIFTSNI